MTERLARRAGGRLALLKKGGEVPLPARRRLFVAFGLEHVVRQCACVHVFRQEACSCSQVLFDGLLGKTQSTGDLLLRQLPDTAEPHDFATFTGEAVEGSSESCELLFGHDALLRRNLVY